MKSKLVARIAGFLSAAAGAALILYTIMPIISYSLGNGTYFGQYLSPVPEVAKASENIDYTKASNWFPGEPLEFDGSKVRNYTLSIPKLKISEATVAIGGEDLSESLIQYPGTALPGKKGNAVIFGHSILPQFYNPKDYMAIFSTLPTIKKGDGMSVRYDGISYKFVVEDVFEVKPTDLEILAQNTSDSYLTLVTCTPPGHPLRPKRLIVRAKLEPFGTMSDSGQSTWN